MKKKCNETEKNVARQSMRKNLHIQMRYSLREQKEGDRKEKNNAFLILMWDVFCLEGADALKCTHCGSWKKKKMKH